MINISKENIQIQVSDIHNVELSTVETKRGTKLQAYNHITTILNKVLHQDFQQLFNVSMSCGSFINLKPFDVSQPTEKEIEIHLCSKCLNHVSTKLQGLQLTLTCQLHSHSICAKI